MPNLTAKKLAEIQRESFNQGLHFGEVEGERKAKERALAVRQSGIVEISRAVADLATANAKLTYALSRITDKLL